jgi:hypothetical protein
LIVQAAAQSGVGLGQAQSKTARLWIHIGRSSLSGNASFLLSCNVDPLQYHKKNPAGKKVSTMVILKAEIKTRRLVCGVA